jgi:hypothetical protein
MKSPGGAMHPDRAVSLAEAQMFRFQMPARQTLISA